MLPEMISQSRAQPSRAVAVHDAESAGPGEERAVEGLLHFLDRLFEPAADDVDFGSGSGEIGGRLGFTPFPAG